MTGGEETERKFNLAAHRLIIDDNLFYEKFLKETSRKLSSRLLRAFDMLEQDERPRKQFHRLQRHFAEVFDEALHIKSQAITDGYTYCPIWPVSGDVFDDHFMTTCDHMSEDTRSRMVGTPLVPGLLSRRCDTKILDYCGFVRAGCRDASGFELHSEGCQAIVDVQTID